MNIPEEILHESLLKIMDANRTRFGLHAVTLVVQLRALAVVASKDEVIAALEYLGSRKPALVAETLPEINRENRAWKITEDGIRYVDQHGL